MNRSSGPLCSSAVGSSVPCSPVAAPFKASAKWITGGLTEKHTQEIGLDAIEGLSSGPPALLTPWQEIRIVSEQKTHLLPSLLRPLPSISFHLLFSALLLFSPQLHPSSSPRLSLLISPNIAFAFFSLFTSFHHFILFCSLLCLSPLLLSLFPPCPVAEGLTSDC